MEPSPSHSGRYLIIRTDRIGDVVLTLPLAGLVHAHVPNAHVTFLVREYTRELVQGQPGVDDVLTVDRQSEAELFRAMRTSKFDVAVHVFPRPHLAWLTWRSGIPTRVGTAFRWYSFLFTDRVSDHRRDGTLHEAMYNARLLGPLGIPVPETIRPRLQTSNRHHEGARRVLARVGLSDRDRFVVVHPGSGGSARSWGNANVGSLVRELLGGGVKVVVTGSEQEVDLAEQIVRHAGGAAVSVAGMLSVMELAAFLSYASLFISNSTGPLHIAAAVGAPVIGFFPPSAAMGAHRWGPLAERAFTFTPDLARCSRCAGKECQGNTCMDQITVGMVAERARELLSTGNPP